MKDKKIRLNKFLALYSFVSRRTADTMISQGKVTVNGTSASLGMRVDPEKDTVAVNGEEIEKVKEFVYLALNKPKGVVSTAEDTHDRQTVVEMVSSPTRLYPVGRLDIETHGLLLLTNDGALTYKLTHPKFHIPKTYRVRLLGSVADETIAKLRRGVVLDDGRTRPAKVSIVYRHNKETLLEIVIQEGRKRQIRRMCAALHVALLDLQRTAFGPIHLGDLKSGKWRKLTNQEVEALKGL